MIVILVPGRDAMSFVAPRSLTRVVMSAVLLPLLSGVVAERSSRFLREEARGATLAGLAQEQESGLAPEQESGGTTSPHYALVADALRSLGNAPSQPEAAAQQDLARAAVPERSDARASLAPSVTLAAAVGLPSSPVVNVRLILNALAARHRGVPSDEDLAAVPTNGLLRLQSLHLGEELSVRPFDDALRPDAAALAQIDHVMRCRVTGNEIGIDPRLVAVLVQLHGLYGKTIQLVSGHRTPLLLGTKRTSQHTLGRAADIRIPGVSIEELKRVAIKFGARGVGLYPEKGFVHVDVRQKARYYWIYTAADGEQPDMGMARPARSTPSENTVVQPPSDSDADWEAEDRG